MKQFLPNFACGCFHHAPQIRGIQNAEMQKEVFCDGDVITCVLLLHWCMDKELYGGLRLQVTGCEMSKRRYIYNDRAHKMVLHAEKWLAVFMIKLNLCLPWFWVGFLSSKVKGHHLYNEKSETQAVEGCFVLFYICLFCFCCFFVLFCFC